MSNVTMWIGPQEVAETCGCSVNHAYKIIRDLNEELKAAGYITIQGKVSRAFFNSKYWGAAS